MSPVYRRVDWSNDWRLFKSIENILLVDYEEMYYCCH